MHLRREPPPSVAAFNLSHETMKSLFPSLSSALQPYLKNYQSLYGGVFWKVQKQLEIRKDPSATTSSSRFKFPLNFRAEVGESQSAKALVATKDEVLSQISLVLSRLPLQVFDLNLEKLKKARLRPFVCFVTRPPVES